MKVITIDSKNFEIRHQNGSKVMRVKLICTNPDKNMMEWQFKHQNGMSKYFEQWDKGLEFYEKKGW